MLFGESNALLRQPCCFCSFCWLVDIFDSEAISCIKGSYGDPQIVLTRHLSATWLA